VDQSVHHHSENGLINAMVGCIHDDVSARREFYCAFRTGSGQPKARRRAMSWLVKSLKLNYGVIVIVCCQFDELLILSLLRFGA
jgi:hypothetical protein